ncbi:MAG: AlwI family type II restriction endonuclease, partial [Alphaproteobacteria bacterium]|nr:AlwI family type II restriction endonuclease [Alphaproteobacteria bacterium]
MPIRFRFKSYAWSLGSTSFRMADFHRKIEEQLSLIHEFWAERENITWDKETQKDYYNFLYSKGFITGKITKDGDKAKTAREKTSGLTDIGLIDEKRKLTPVGEKLLEIVNSGDFSPDNEFQISKDSFIYLKQLIKTSCRVESG